VNVGPDTIDAILSALDEQLRQRGARYEIVTVGGSALVALGLIFRATKDVDVVALVKEGLLISAKPFPEPLAAATARVGRDLMLDEGWLNPGPTDLLDFGLPDGFWSRVQSRCYGEFLTVDFAGRLDQVHLKLFAMADQGPGRHEADLRALGPTHDELVTAARWTRTHDPSEGFRSVLEQALHYLGVDDADLGD
jgi:hypothetical protein